MKIIITGGAGFLGSNLAEMLLKRGEQVIVLDNFCTSSREALQRLRQYDRFEFIEHDVSKPFDLACDQVYNLACPASPPLYQINPIRTSSTCFNGALHCLELGKKYGATIFQASTSEVYGDPLVHPQSESYRGNVNTTGPRACYDEGKRMAESLFADYQRTTGVDIRIARIFNTYGPYMKPNDGRVISNFIVQALKGQNISVYGKGQQTRSFCYVDDLIHGFDLLMNHCNHRSPVNLGSPDEFTIDDLARMIIEKINSKLKIVYLPLPQDDPLRRNPDISKAKKVLNWQPKIPLSEGLEKTIAHFDEVLASS